MQSQKEEKKRPRVQYVHEIQHWNLELHKPEVPKRAAKLHMQKFFQYTKNFLG